MAMKFSVNPLQILQALPWSTQSPWPDEQVHGLSTDTPFSIQHGVPVLLPLHLTSSSYGKRPFNIISPSFMRAFFGRLFDCERAGLVDMSAAFFSAQAQPNEWFTPSLALQQLKTCAANVYGNAPLALPVHGRAPGDTEAWQRLALR